MKIALVSPMTFLAAVIIGVVLAIAISPLITPHPIETPKIEITPVPTPAPVYIQPTAAPTPVQVVGDGDGWYDTLAILVVLGGAVVLILPIILFLSDD